MIVLHSDCAAANSLGDIRLTGDTDIIDVVVSVDDAYGEQVTWLQGLPRTIGERIAGALKATDVCA
jgi:hypothetical protein